MTNNLICYFVVVVGGGGGCSMCVPSLGFVGMRLSISYVFIGVVNFLGLEFSFQYLLRAGFVDRYSLKLTLS